MKTDRFSSASIRVALACLAALLVATDSPAAGRFTIHVGGGSLTFATDSRKLSDAVAKNTEAVRKAFDENRKKLKNVPGSDGAPAFLVEQVSGLIAQTSEDLGKALEDAEEPKREPKLTGLKAWKDEELGNILQRLAAHAPVKVAQVASLGSLPLPAAAPKPATATVPTSTANQLLDGAKAVLERIFVLASNNDLEVELWIGSTPADEATFRFWPQGHVGSAPAPTIIETNGKKDHVVRGLYNYRASLADGSVTELIAYPNQAGASEAGLTSERLDLVNGSSFFCCRFDQQYCQHVATKKECRP